MFGMQMILLTIFLIQRVSCENYGNGANFTYRVLSGLPINTSTLVQKTLGVFGLISLSRNQSSVQKIPLYQRSETALSPALKTAALKTKFHKHRSKRSFAQNSNGARHVGVNITVPNNMTRTEMLFFWEYLVCPDSAFCEEQEDYSPQVDCSPFYCDACFCNNYTKCENNKECCVDHLIAARKGPLDKLDYISCTSGSSSVTSSNQNEVKWHYFVNKCPTNFTDDDIIQRCEQKDPFRSPADILTDLPVYSAKHQVDYFNSYCAKCHGDDGSATTWVPEIRCSEYFDVSDYRSQIDLITATIKNKGCFVTSSPPKEHKPVSCESPEYVIKSCNVSGKWYRYDPDIQVACNMYNHKIYIDNNFYSNIFCAFCNGISQNEIEHIFQQEFLCGTTPPVGLQGISFSALFNFQQQPKTSTFHTKNDTAECPVYDVYDPFSVSIKTAMSLILKSCQYIPHIMPYLELIYDREVPCGSRHSGGGLQGVFAPFIRIESTEIYI